MRVPAERGAATGGLADIGGGTAYRIDRVETLEPFLTTVVSATDLWMFVSSTGALTAGRRDADHALLPYATDDRLHRAAGVSGPVTVIERPSADGREHWMPFGGPCPTWCTRSIAKGVLSEVLVLEEHNERWDLTFRTSWSPSPSYGWVREVAVINESGRVAELRILDGLLDVMPAGVDALTEQIRSNLVDAYKRAEAGPWGTCALYTLESLITDRAEPAEALAATIVWSSGFPTSAPGLDERAVADVLAGRRPRVDRLLTGRPGAYLLHGDMEVAPNEPTSWTIVADTALDHAAVVERIRDVARSDIGARVRADVEVGRDRLRSMLDGADAFQHTADPIADAHHASNVLFNAMRGGVFPHGDRVPVADLVGFLQTRNRDCRERHDVELRALGPWSTLPEVHLVADRTGDPDLVRLVLEYLPLTFSRRHGDPSRPWNAFSIEVTDDAGDELLTYEGNWRDIFQNWEALLQSYPEYHPHVVAKFVNATTADGHNAYRLTRDGIDWEVPEPDNPWSNIGYWGDHQIVYLLRLLESWERFAPGAIGRWLDRPVFVFADVPYSLCDHDEMLRAPHDTITYDVERARAIERREERIGTDGRLLVTPAGGLARAGLLEKLLVPALGRLSAFVPGGGMWLNTQRPEWNDANNALAGTGLSMVTLAHLVRYLTFVRDLVARCDVDTVPMSSPVVVWLHAVTDALANHEPDAATDDRRRRVLLDALGSIGTAHRHRLADGLDDTTVRVGPEDVERLCSAALAHLTHTLELAQRADGLYHSYNRISFPTVDSARVEHLGPMLEGQVAVLSSGHLDGRASLALVEAIAESDMYRPDQDSFMLYPEIVRPSFLDRNTLAESHVARAPFLATPLDERWRRVLVAGPDDRLHFRPAMTNAAALREALDGIGATGAEREVVEQIYEELFDHASFTGRSEAMYGYEGIGSIYWHMVAKLLLAVQERWVAALDAGEPPDVVDGLAAAYRRVRDGLGFRTSPGRFGAFPTDCYSHSPAGGGAKQPGMTGQVKEEILTRLGEIGLRVEFGTLRVRPTPIDPTELFGRDLSEPVRLTVCAVPVTVDVGDEPTVAATWADGRLDTDGGGDLSAAAAAEVFRRTGAVAHIGFTVSRPEIA